MRIILSAYLAGIWMILAIHNFIEGNYLLAALQLLASVCNGFLSSILLEKETGKHW